MKFMEIGLLGGSFDPIHNGHLYMAKQALEEYHLDEVWFVPAGHSPNKDENKMTPAAHRKAMCELAVQDIPKFHVCDIETEAKERSYTYRTIEKLTAQYPMHRFYFIMGADSLDYFDQWVHPESISASAVILVISRDHMEETALKNKIQAIKALFPADIRIIHAKKCDVSSHEIREKLSKMDDVSMLLPKEILSYIRKQHLY